VSIVLDDLRRFRGKALAGIGAAEEAGDRGTANLLDPVVDHLDKQIWMLEAFLAE
jgi:DNA-binding ferritin-like protein